MFSRRKWFSYPRKWLSARKWNLIQHGGYSSRTWCSVYCHLKKVVAFLSDVYFPKGNSDGDHFAGIIVVTSISQFLGVVTSAYFPSFPQWAQWAQWTDLLGPELLVSEGGEELVPLSFRHGAGRVAVAAVVTIQVHLAKEGQPGAKLWCVNEFRTCGCASKCGE